MTLTINNNILLRGFWCKTFVYCTTTYVLNPFPLFPPAQKKKINVFHIYLLLYSVTGILASVCFLNIPNFIDCQFICSFQPFSLFFYLAFLKGAIVLISICYYVLLIEFWHLAFVYFLSIPSFIDCQFICSFQLLFPLLLPCFPQRSNCSHIYLLHVLYFVKAILALGLYICFLRIPNFIDCCFMFSF